MALVVTEQITAYLVCTTTQRRNQLRNVVAAYLDRPRAGARDFAIFDVPAGKYGAGPTLVVNAPFASRADADNAWADLSAFNPSFLIAGSVARQFTSTEDIDQGINENVFHHERHWPAEPGDF